MDNLVKSFWGLERSRSSLVCGSTREFLRKGYLPGTSFFARRMQAFYKYVALDVVREGLKMDT
ncbi:hypothetical protein D9Q81_09490 [Candidatus Korarchaeum cryptofilum]|uniref:Uncharacterized protein n=1 Tax=Candidatus Korarchaeum cryptofilum TaxID=498846 RepID=A0A429FZN3_9CREN|nr:hypothetical protein [Candidatus Korarchaeum cryptofilum]RSN66979.1 hypothetical protein D9Q81_09490 [Candidatus Korarchaeum cryptofilum]